MFFGVVVVVVEAIVVSVVIEAVVSTVVVEALVVSIEIKSVTLFGPYTESLHEAPQISLSLPEQGWLHSSEATGTNFESSFPQ